MALLTGFCASTSASVAVIDDDEECGGADAIVRVWRGGGGGGGPRTDKLILVLGTCLMDRRMQRSARMGDDGMDLERDLVPENWDGGLSYILGMAAAVGYYF